MIHSTVDPSKSTMRVPAMAGPIRMVTPATPSRMPTMRSAESPERRSTAGSSASRAVIPGTSPTAPMMPKRMNQPRLRPVIASTIGSAATAAAEIRSVTTDEVRRLMRSMTTPMSRPAMIAGTAVAAATVPAPRALPVACRTMSGSATPAIELPSRESA